MSDGVVIVGGGPAGAAAAIALASAGRPIRLIERRRATGDPICGGFLSWRTLARLDRLGIDAVALGGQRVTALTLFAGSETATSPLPRAAMGVSRHRLDTLLLARAAAVGANIERGVHVRAIDDDGTLRCGAAGSIPTATLVLATGKHEIAGARRAMPARLASDPVLGLRIRLPASPALTRLVGDAIELHLFDRGYAGLVRHEDGSGNLCLAVRTSRLAAAGGDPLALLAMLGADNPRLGERLALADAAPRADAIAQVPYGFVARTTLPGRWRIGDAAAVIPSLAGEGIGIALASAEAAARALLNGGDAQAFQTGFARRAAAPMRIADLAWRGAEHPRVARVATRIARALPALPRAVARATRIA